MGILLVLLHSRRLHVTRLFFLGNTRMLVARPLPLGEYSYTRYSSLPQGETLICSFTCSSLDPLGELLVCSLLVAPPRINARLLFTRHFP
jgi:hypothetical protein